MWRLNCFEWREERKTNDARSPPRFRAVSFLVPSFSQRGKTSTCPTDRDRDHPSSPAQVREMTEWGKEGETERSEGRKGESSSNFNSSWGKVEVACGDPRRPMTRAGRHVLLQIQHGNSRLESTRAMVGDGEDCWTQGAHDY